MWRINSIPKPANLAYNGAGEVSVGSFDGRKDGKHNGIGFVEIYKIHVTQDAFFFGMGPSDSVPEINGTSQ